MDSNFLVQAVIFLGAAVISVPISKRLGLGSVLGYLIAGVAIGPSGFSLVGDSAGSVQQFSSFGIVMLLFLVGLELEPARLWSMRGQLFGLGGLQVVITALALAALGPLFGVSFRVSLAAGLILALSSTAIIVQSLQERNLRTTPGGQAVFAVLLFQAIAIIPLLALWPLLAAAPDPSATAVEDAPGGWQQAVKIAIALTVIIVGGRYLIRPVFRFIAKAELRELFTATALLIVVGIAALTEWVGLSAALGTFIGGVLLADSEYRNELMSDVEPFKGLLLGLFFITVGAGLDLRLIEEQPWLIAGLLAAMVVFKIVVLLVLGRLFKLEWSQTLLLALGLVVGDEFAFVLCSLSLELGVLTPAQANPLVATVALSMALTPLLFLIYEKRVAARMAKPAEKRAQDTIETQDNPVIIAGFGRFGHIVGRLLRANGVGVTILDLDPDHVELVRRLGIKAFYGDATRLDLLHASGAASAKALVIAIDNEAQAVELADTARKNFPHLRIFARASGRVHAYEYQKRGHQGFYRETLDSSLHLGRDLMQHLGFRAYQAKRAAQIFRTYDERSMRELAEFWEDDDTYFNTARQHMEAFEQMFLSDRGDAKHDRDRGWDPMPPGDSTRG